MNKAPKKIYLANIEGDLCTIPLFNFDLKENDYVKYIRSDIVEGMREALEGIASSGCCLTSGCNVEDPLCDAMIARAALEVDE